MACLLALVLAATVLTVPPGKLTNAARTSSPAEAFWRTALPDAPMPEAIRELLHPRAEATVPNDVKPKDDDDPPVPPMTFKYDDYRAASPRNDNGAAAWPTVFFLEDAVRVGESLPFRSIAPRAPAAAAEATLRLYTVRAVRAVEGSRFVVCRREAGPGVVYGCRATGPARAYVVDVAGGDVAVAAAVVCHTDTSQWDPAHAAFRLLDVKPGGAAVCHALPDAQQVLPAKNGKSPSPA
ncbi:BURP domain-containing protein 15-like [Phragmites australis]|uniref:BURP domain-containing protein 15-like n=1 Tax=Phragmites australis TaxID=29695 RepID=UPI002D79C50A|nr:BURP domain-containing protein 15-like [Phragmites australis]